MCVRERERKWTFWPSTLWPLTLDLRCKSCGFLPFLHRLSKPLTTNLCGVLCTSCWKPGSCWPPVKEDPLHHGGDTLTVLLSLSEEGPLPPHTHTKPHTTTHTLSLAVVKGQTQWHKVHTVTFFSYTGANVNACTCTWVHKLAKHTQFLLSTQTVIESQFPHHTLSTLATETILLLTPSFTHTHEYTHTLELRHYALMYSGLSLQVTWPLLSCLSEREESIQPDGSGAE